ncbi:hypothetical protein [Mangrovihabitans endophyticus]|uniref:Uncharacterized protein n=1 Tax=Mangrovihabitans endophyticus TaxID=1751298 RepID=A0A8J3C4N1_9ACTN|nr:hypothetical protein [Mangrovihabitans endophyticus]GGL18268.1 hypothetical protein GCM10012284_61070 [Mangrovihabitans endophyticus]
MTDSWHRRLPAPARPVATACVAAVAAATEHDEAGLTAATGDLAALDPGRVGLVLGTAVRVRLEETHPDGLDSDDVRAVLARSVRAAAQWRPGVDPQTMLFLLASALGVQDEDGAPPPAGLAEHAALLLADLLPAAGPDAAAALIERAFTEIEKSQLND